MRLNNLAEWRGHRQGQDDRHREFDRQPRLRSRTTRIPDSVDPARLNVTRAIADAEALMQSPAEPRPCLREVGPLPAARFGSTRRAEAGRRSSLITTIKVPPFDADDRPGRNMSRPEPHQGSTTGVTRNKRRRQPINLILGLSSRCCWASSPPGDSITLRRMVRQCSQGGASDRMLRSVRLAGQGEVSVIVGLTAAFRLRPVTRTGLRRDRPAIECHRRARSALLATCAIGRRAYASWSPLPTSPEGRRAGAPAPARAARPEPQEDSPTFRPLEPTP